MKNSVKLFASIFTMLLFVINMAFAQQWLGPNNSTSPIYRSGPAGIGQTTNPLSTLSINADGDIRYGAYVRSTSIANGSVGLYSEVFNPSSAFETAGHYHGVFGYVPSGKGYTYGVTAASYSNTANAHGRAVGLNAYAGNATSGYNYGIMSRLLGSNSGTALVAWDGISAPNWNQQIVGGNWASYNIGRSYFSDKVGIGTTNPETALQVEGGDISISRNNRIVFGVGGNGHGEWIKNAGFGLSFFTNFQERLRINYDGKVSIGTTNTPPMVGNTNTSAYRLFVAGGILTEEILVQTGWADYVFKKGYKKPTLEEEEKTIKEKGHLYNVPSEKEVKENGLKLAEMTVKQQEKIEEIYLHLIEMDKEIKTLKAENEQLKQALKHGKSRK